LLNISRNKRASPGLSSTRRILIDVLFIRLASVVAT
jgi:hypothetical protein